MASSIGVHIYTIPCSRRSYTHADGLDDDIFDRRAYIHYTKPPTDDIDDNLCVHSNIAFFVFIIFAFSVHVRCTHSNSLEHRCLSIRNLCVSYHNTVIIFTCAGNYHLATFVMCTHNRTQCLHEQSAEGSEFCLSCASLTATLLVKSEAAVSGERVIKRLRP